MKKLLISLFVLSFLSPVFPQNKGLISKVSFGETSLFVGAGPTKMSGDIGGDNFKSIFKNDMGYGYSFGVRYLMKYNVALKVFGDYSLFRGKDTPEYNGARTNYYHSNVVGLGGQIEILLFGNPFAESTTPHSVYLLAGGKKNFVTAETSIIDESILNSKEQPLAFIIGAGYQFRLSRAFSLGFEAKENYYNSDYVDGYNAPVKANKHKDASFDLKFIASYSFPITKRDANYDNRWDRK